MQNIKIRTYQTQDLQSVLDLLVKNTPKFFAPPEIDDLKLYLEKEREDYFIIEENGAIIGAVGINYFPDQKTACLSWDILSPDQQGKGIGTKLVEYRINLIKQQKYFEKIIVRTSQLVYNFYEKLGFKVVKSEKDYWGQGLDLVEMELLV